MPDAGGPDRVLRALDLAARETDMDIALVTEIADERETVLWTSQPSKAYPRMRAGASLPLGETICQRLLERRIPGVVPNTAAEGELADVALVRDGEVGAYLGVPLRTADARLYMLCCLAREQRTALGDDDLRFLAGVAETVRAVVEDN